jgi:eukaryotic-like serine/threonine-protein kinase
MIERAMQTAPIATAPVVVAGELLAGKYRVERILGEGGMGIVVGATNEALGQRVAINLLRPGALGDHEALGRFIREARAAASLRSEHVARVIDTATLEDGRPYIVMEYLEGRDLGDVIGKEPPLAIHEAVDFVLQTCEAIAEAHAAGIVHRDLKPKNLFLTATAYGKPQVKVLDFGISKVDGPQEMQLTSTTEVIGSPSYMSPEQLRSARNVDARTDIWALGVILYELLTKRLPFYANTVTELVAVVLMEEPPPLRALRPDVPDALAAAVARCLAKRPHDRFGSVIELVSAIEPFAAGAIGTASDRVRALASNRALPPAAASSGQLPPAAPSGPALHQAAATGPTFAIAPTSQWPEATPLAKASGPTGQVAWADTRREQARSLRWGVALALAAAGLLVAGTAAVTAAWYVKRASATEVAPAPPPPPAEPLPLPPGRKDLPPLDAPAPAPPLDAPALPSARTSAPVKPPKPPKPARATAPKGDDPLSNIGRR